MEREEKKIKVKEIRKDLTLKSNNLKTYLKKIVYINVYIHKDRNLRYINTF